MPTYFSHFDRLAVTLKTTEQIVNKAKPSGRIPLALFLAYPVSLHVSIQYHQLWLGPYLVIGLIALTSLPLIQQRSYFSLGLLLTGCGLLVLFTALISNVETLIFWPPIIIQLLLGLSFLYSLTPGQIPMVTRLATQLDGELCREEKEYTRIVTRVWVVLLFMLTLESALLAIYAPLPLWSMFTNGINYVIIFLALLIEYRIHVYKFPKKIQRSLLNFLASLTQVRINN